MDQEATTKHNVLERMLLDQSAGPTHLPLSLLMDITGGFSDDQEIGSGGFAVIYKGVLGNGTVAVKKLLNTHIHEKKFHQEVECLMKTRHANIVRFLGYCADTQGKMSSYNGKFVMADVQQRLLCFEYLPNGSLDVHITDALCGLKWSKRYQIIKGICTGLHYLHHNRIAHLDLKPANVLLDDNMLPKIADFGLSRCFNEMQSQFVTSKLVGSMGYLAPEFYGGQITLKLDIYSLGVIIMEILTGQKGCPEIEDVLAIWSIRLKKSDGDEDLQLEQIRVCAEIAMECTASNPAERPAAQHILEMLGETITTEWLTQTTNVTSSPVSTSPWENYAELHQGTSKVLAEGVTAHERRRFLKWMAALEAGPYQDEKHRLAIAVATAAEAAIAAAMVALAELKSPCIGEDVAAAIKIQSVFRSYKARKALCELGPVRAQGVVRLQALVRGQLARVAARHASRCVFCASTFRTTTPSATNTIIKRLSAETPSLTDTWSPVSGQSYY